MRNRTKGIIKNNNNGFTLVELVVVLVLMTILLSIAIFGGLAWQDWSQFQHENSVAEEIFFAAQNQLIEYDSSGALERNVLRVVKDGSGYNEDLVIAYSYKEEGGTIAEYYNTAIQLASIKDDTYTSGYSWDSIWATSSETGEAMGLNTNLHKETRSILTLSAKSGDYSDYISLKSGDTSVSLSDGTILLFDLIAPYISDSSVLNGSIVLEFSPENAQVLSVCYCDRTDELVYAGDSSVSSGQVGIYDRTTFAREKKMLGYYSVGQLTEKIKGKNISVTNAALKIYNNEMLSLVVKDDSINDNSKLEFIIYDGDSDTNDTKIMSFTIKYEDIKNIRNMEDASQNPVRTRVTFYDEGKYKNYPEGDRADLCFRFPVWVDGNEQVHVILDAADVQAGTSVYSTVKTSSGVTVDDNKAKAFRNTFSFYRFGLADEVNYIYASVAVYEGDSSSGVTPAFSSRDTGRITADHMDGCIPHKELFETEGTCGECTTFATYALENDIKNFTITNGRHLYNMRYETEYKGDSDKNNTFILSADIDWSEFVGTSGEGSTNYFLNSYDFNSDNTELEKFGNSGIKYEGNIIIHTDSDGASYTEFCNTSVNKNIDTEVFPFPSFKCLGKGDTFKQDLAYGKVDSNDADAKSFTISNLYISFSANVFYGIYDDVIEDTTAYGAAADTAIKSQCKSGNFDGLLGIKNAEEAGSAGSSLTRGGAMPLGLFCENLGTISRITLNKHVVNGAETFTKNSVRPSDKTPDQVVSTNMVGGFAGNNLGTIEELTVLDYASNDSVTNSTADLLGRTSVNGRTDVGGIIGRESYIVSTADTREVEIKDMKNYGTITGMENVGGIVGRAYRYSSTFTSDFSGNSNRYKRYHDGYFITDSNKSMSGTDVAKVENIIIENCSNRGMVSGDNAFIGDKNHSDYRCAFIGGIAGCTIDGYVTDDDATGYSFAKYVQSGFLNENGGSEKVKVKNCDSYIRYDVTDITTLRSTQGLRTIFRALDRDYYVGGLVGYARLTAFENCNKKPDNRMYENTNGTGATACYVMGAGYVGGIVGCADATRFDRDSAAQGDSYSATNYNNVIGKVAVGGISGCFGIGGTNVSFRNPASNSGSSPQPIPSDGDHKYVTGRFMLNKAAVMCLKSDNKYDGSMRVDFSKYAYSTDSTGACGGIAGITCSSIADSKNIQSNNVKGLITKLITFNSKTVDELYAIDDNGLCAVNNASVFGGEMVGGIIGYALPGGYLNPTDGTPSLNNPTAEVDAIVYGQDMVGGFVGKNDKAMKAMKNLYPTLADSSDGMIVIGNDIVGGFCGELQSSLENSNPVTIPYAVKGRYGVGGIVGEICNEGSTDGTIDNVKMTIDISEDNNSGRARATVDGVGYVGGYLGISDNRNDIDMDCKLNLADMDVTGRYFAGGLYGAVLSSGRQHLDEINEKDDVVVSSSVKVKAQAYAGGVVGLYGVTSSGYVPFVTMANGRRSGTLSSNVEGALIDGTEYKGYVDAYSYVAGRICSGTDLFSKGATAVTIDLRDNENLVADVEAEIFAGGLFGYVPDGMDITVNGFTNISNIHTTGHVGNGNGSVVESYDDTVQYSYLGGITGRVPMGMIVKNSSNTVKGKYTEDADKYYYADAASYLGGITEVNAGIITGETVEDNGNETIHYLVNQTEYKYDEFAGSIGAFAGVNGTKITKGYSNDGMSGVIQYCKNEAEISAENAAGIAASAGGKSYIGDCLNVAKISGTDNSGDNGNKGHSAGILYAAHNNISGEVRVFKCTNLGQLSGDRERAGIAYDTKGYGVIQKCSNYGAGVTNGITCKTANIVTQNLEASGLSEEVGSMPIGPAATSDNTKNFYIFGNAGDTDAANVGMNDVIEKKKIGFTAKANIVDFYGLFGIPNIFPPHESNVVPASDIYCGRNENSSPLWNRVDGSGKTWKLVLNPVEKSGNSVVSTGIYMDSFSIVWTNRSLISGIATLFTNREFAGDYEVSFKYIDTDGIEKTSESKEYSFAFSGTASYTNDISVPQGVKITEITISADYDKQGSQGWFTFYYFC